MSNNQEEIELTRDVSATLIPHGEEFNLPQGEKVTITHRLGGNFTVMTLQGMYRIAAKDADALGEEASASSHKNQDGNQEPANAEKIRENLKSVFDPEIPVDIYELGLIYDVFVNEADEVKVLMTLTTPNCPVAETLPQEVEEKVKSLDEVKDAEVEITFDPPWSQDLMSEEAKLELGLL